MASPFAKTGLGIIPRTRGGRASQDFNIRGRGPQDNTNIGGVLAGGAAAGTAASTAFDAVNSNDNSSNSPEGGMPVQQLLNLMKELSSDKTGASLESLKAPLNAAIMGWLQSNASVVNDFFSITGLKPTDMIDKIVSGFRNRNAGASLSNVNDTMLAILETSKERAALKSDEHEFKAGYEERVGTTLGTLDQWENLATGVATLRLAAESIPGGVRSLLALREALEMEKPFFNECFRRVYGYDPEAWVGSAIDNYQSRVALVIK